MTRKLKVLMVGALPLDLQSVKGGVEAAILNLFSGFSHLKEVEIVHLSFVEGLTERTEVEFSPNIKIYFIPFKVKIRLLDYLLNRGVVKKIISEESPDLIHIQESEPHLLRFVGLQRRNIVVTQHGIMKEELKYATGVKGKLKFLFKAFIERFIFPRFKNVIFISSYNKKLFKGSVIKSDNIYNAVNPLFFNHTPTVSVNKHSIIYVGVLSKRKNIRIVIDAISELKKRNMYYELHVVGWYKDKDVEYEKEILGLIKKYDLSSQIKFYGWLKQHEILSVFDKCSTFILPSLQETLPVSIAEAMALGKIVIASDVGAISEMFEDKVSGYLFSKNDLNMLVDLMEKLYNNEETLVYDAIRKTAIEKYHPDENAVRTLKFYNEILAGNK